MALASLATDAQLARYLSEFGITSWADHDSDLVDDPNVLEDCKTYGTSYIVSRLVQRYTAATLATVPMMIEIACVVILRHLTFRRGNPPPASLELRYQEVVAKDGTLDQIASGRLQLVDADGVAVRMANANAPSHSNLMVDRRFAERRVRVVSGNSNMAPSKLRRDIDLFQEHDL